MKRALAISALLFTAVAHAQPALVPWPKSVEQHEGVFALQLVNILEGEGAQGWGAMLRADLLAMGAMAQTQDEILRSIRFQRDDRMGKEAYLFTVAPDQVTIAAGSREGALHATQTLRQLVRKENTGTWSWPCMRVEDAPAFTWRGTMLDVSRHFYSVDFIKHYLDELARLKLNIFHWHLTDDQGWRVEVKKYPKLTAVGAWRTESDGSRYGGYYTQEEVQDVVRYAEERGITVVPEIEFPGHCTAALAAYPELGCRQDTLAVATTWGVFHDVYCMGWDSTWTFFRDVLDEMIPLFPSPWFHIGGDEVPKDRWEHCTACQDRMAKEGLADEAALQAWAIKRVQAHLLRKGKHMVAWDEVLEGGLDKAAVVEVWRGDEEARKARANGNPMVRTIYFDASPANLTLADVKGFDPRLDGTSAGILGAECPVWSEAIDPRNLGYNVFPRLQVFAERMWTNGTLRNDLDQRIAPHVARLEHQGWITATADKDLFHAEVRFDPEVRAWRVSTSFGRPEMNVAWTTGQDSGHFVDTLLLPAPTTVHLTPRWKDQAIRDATVVTIVPTLALGARQTVAPAIDRRYGRDHTHGLTDGLLGTSNYGDGLWHGWWGLDPVITIDLDSARTVHEVSIRCMQQVGSWIVLPRNVEYQVSGDGVVWQTLATATHNVPLQGTGQLVHVFSMRPEVPVSARYIRATLHNSGKLPAWHAGAGHNSWVFVDEVVVR